MTDKNPDPGVVYWLWSFDPTDGHVTLHANDGTDYDTPNHEEMASEIAHPSRLDGYAYPIGGGYRLTTNDHAKLEDPFVTQQVLSALRG